MDEPLQEEKQHRLLKEKQPPLHMTRTPQMSHQLVSYVTLYHVQCMDGK